MIPLKKLVELKDSVLIKNNDSLKNDLLFDVVKKIMNVESISNRTNLNDYKNYVEIRKRSIDELVYAYKSISNTFDIKYVEIIYDVLAIVKLYDINLIRSSNTWIVSENFKLKTNLFNIIKELFNKSYDIDTNIIYVLNQLIYLGELNNVDIETILKMKIEYENNIEFLENH